MKPHNFIDLSGQKFGRLTTIKPIGGGYWECKCDCGVVCKKRASHIKVGASKSCGCYNKELMLTKFKTHGLSKHPLMKIHNAIMGRCYNENTKSYKYYGGRGISVCRRWHKFENFYDDMVDGYKTGLSIERDDVNGNYELSNCRWATTIEQSRNRRDNVFLQYNGEKMVMADWAKKAGMDKRTLWMRIKLGWDVERALTEPVKLGRR